MIFGYAVVLFFNMLFCSRELAVSSPSQTTSLVTVQHCKVKGASNMESATGIHGFKPASLVAVVLLALSSSPGDVRSHLERMEARNMSASSEHLL